MGRERLRDRRERAAPRRRRARALGRAGGCRALRRRRGRTGERRGPARPAPARAAPREPRPEPGSRGDPPPHRRARGLRRVALRPAPRRGRRPAGRRQRDQAHPARERRRGGAARGVGGVEDRRCRGRRRRPRARAPAERGGALARLPGLVRARGRDVRDGRDPALRDARRVRPADRRSRSRAGRRTRTPGSQSASAVPWARPAALALRGPVLPGGARRRRGRPDRRLRRQGRRRPRTGDVRAASGVDTGPILDRSDLFPREGKCQHAFCIDVDREGDVRVLANVVADRYWADTMLHELGHGAYDIGFDRIAAVAPARLPPDRDGGHRDPDGTPRAGRRVAPRGRRRRRRRRPSGSRPAFAQRSQPSCSSSRAGCS